MLCGRDGGEGCLHFLIALLCRSHELCEPEVLKNVKRDLI